MPTKYRSVLMVRNPAAGGAKADAYKTIEEILGELGDVSVCEPSSAEDLPDKVQSAAEGADLVVVAGGDGTVNGTVNALQSRIADVTLAIIPLGTGNDFARTLGFADDPLEAAGGLPGGEERSVDVCRASGAGVERLFLNACIGGFPVEVDEELNESVKKRLGPLAFVVGGIKALPNLERSTVVLNDEEVADCIAVGVGNGRTCGGGVEVWPSARADDGLLDGVALCASNVAGALVLGAKVKVGSHEGADGVMSERARKVSVSADPPIEFNVDGELLGLKSPATFEVAGRLRLLVPQRSKNS
jgi:diacylglycerol kinase (ATP)